jgi:Flp pilus assembly protein protease CpaA
MRLIRTLIRLLILVAGAVIGLAVFLFAVLVFAIVLVGSLLTGRKPNVQFRMNQNPWARHRAPAGGAGDVVDIEAREVRDPAPLPLQPPRR